MTDTKDSTVECVDRADNKNGEYNLAQIKTNASTVDEETLKPTNERVDYSGAHEKTNPVEIKLVKKLDWHIMPM